LTILPLRLRPSFSVAQVVYYRADYFDRMLADLLAGSIDVAFTQSGLLEQVKSYKIIQYNIA
jgi:hypothetical protein